MIGYFFAKHGLFLGIVLLIIALIFGLGWKVKGWSVSDDFDRKDAQINQMKLTLSEERAKKAEAEIMTARAALEQIERASYLMRSAVDAVKLDQSKVVASLSGISNELKTLKVAKPLPVDCKPDEGRINSFKKSIDATNSAIKR